VKPAVESTVTPSVMQRVETVLEAAEQAAAEIRKDAEESAEQYTKENLRRADALVARRLDDLSSITDDLLARAHVVVRHSDGLIRALEEASRRAMSHRSVADEDETDVLADLAPRPSELSNARAHSGATDESNGAVSPGARLVATRMAVEGSSRDLIASRLRREFGINDPTAILREAGL
jgi:hypothetical protein